MHWCKAQLSLGSLGASEVTQEPVLPLEGFVLEYCLTLASLRETGTSEEKGKSSHVPRPVVGLHCYLLSPLEKVCTDLLFLGTLFWIGTKTDLQGFTNTSNQKGVANTCQGTTLVC